MNLYGEVIAKYYDASYVAKSDLEDLPFYLELATQAKGTILEIACGTGRVLLELAQAGHEVDGLDYSPELLDVLWDKLSQEPTLVQEKVTLHLGDMRTFDLGKNFDLIIIPFRPFQHMHTTEDQVQALKSARHHLAPGGRLAFDVFYPNYQALEAPIGEEYLDFEWVDDQFPHRTVQRYFVRTQMDLLNQFFAGEFIFRTFENGEQILEERAPLEMSYYTYPQMQLLFEHCGLEIVEEYGSFQKDPIDIRKEMIFILQAK